MVVDSFGAHPDVCVVLPRPKETASTEKLLGLSSWRRTVSAVDWHACSQDSLRKVHADGVIITSSGISVKRKNSV